MLYIGVHLTLYMSNLEDSVKIFKIQLKLSHFNCKSNFSVEYLENVKMTLISSVPFSLKQSLFTVEILYPIWSNKVANDVLQQMKKNSSLQSIQSWSLKDHNMIVSFVEKQVDSPFALLQPLGVFNYREKSYRGIDDIEVTLNVNEISKIMDTLSELGKVQIVSKYDICEDIHLLNHILSKREEDIFKLAVSSGYFENPKNCHLKDLAEKLNISIVATDRYLRTAEKKIFMNCSAL